MYRKVLFCLLTLAVTLGASAQTAKELYAQGKEQYDAKHYDKAFPLLKKAAEKGNKKAQYRLGRCYEKGRGVAANNATAYQWYSKSAAQDYAKAQYRLGKWYLKGKHVTADKKKAKSWLHKAVKNEKHGEEIKQKIKKSAKEGDMEAKEMCALLNIK